MVTPTAPAIDTSPLPFLIISIFCPLTNGTELFNGIVIVLSEEDVTLIVLPASVATTV